MFWSLELNSSHLEDAPMHLATKDELIDWGMQIRRENHLAIENLQELGRRRWHRPEDIWLDHQARRFLSFNE